MEPIIFGYEDAVYKVAPEVYKKELIVLPDGTVLQVFGWLDSNPPQPAELQEVRFLTGGMTPEQIAEVYNGVLAEVTKLED